MGSVFKNLIANSGAVIISILVDATQENHISIPSRILYKIKIEHIYIPSYLVHKKDTELFN